MGRAFCFGGGSLVGEGKAGSLRQAQGRLSTAPSRSLRLRSEWQSMCAVPFASLRGPAPVGMKQFWMKL